MNIVRGLLVIAMVASVLLAALIAFATFGGALVGYGP